MFKDPPNTQNANGINLEVAKATIYQWPHHDPGIFTELQIQDFPITAGLPILCCPFLEPAQAQGTEAKPQQPTVPTSHHSSPALLLSTAHGERQAGLQTSPRRAQLAN